MAHYVCSRQVEPHSPVKDVGHGAPAESVILGEFSVSGLAIGVLGANRDNLRFGQLGIAISLAALPSAMAILVGMILLSRTPAEIVEPVVGRVAVEVTALTSVRTFPDECQKDQAMDKEVAADSLVSSQRGTEMPVEIRSRWLDGFPFGTLKGKEAAMSFGAGPDPATPDRSVAACLVANKSRNVAVLNRRIDLHLKPRLFGVS